MTGQRRGECQTDSKLKPGPSLWHPGGLPPHTFPPGFCIPSMADSIRPTLEPQSHALTFFVSGGEWGHQKKRRGGRGELTSTRGEKKKKLTQPKKGKKEPTREKTKGKGRSVATLRRIAKKQTSGGPGPLAALTQNHIEEEKATRERVKNARRDEKPKGQNKAEEDRQNTPTPEKRKREPKKNAHTNPPRASEQATDRNKDTNTTNGEIKKKSVCVKVTRMRKGRVETNSWFPYPATSPFVIQKRRYVGHTH